jgi:hypothetical protein
MLSIAVLGPVEVRPDSAPVPLPAIAQADHRFGDASHYLEHAATASERLGFLGQAAYHLLHQSDDWYRTAGGGDGALLTRALLAATSDDADADLEAIIDQARLADDHEVEVVVLDALALRLAQRGQLRTAQQLLATADDAVPAAVNVVDEVDRLDAHRARELIRSEAQREWQLSRNRRQRLRQEDLAGAVS